MGEVQTYQRKIFLVMESMTWEYGEIKKKKVLGAYDTFENALQVVKIYVDEINRDNSLVNEYTYREKGLFVSTSNTSYHKIYIKSLIINNPLKAF